MPRAPRRWLEDIDGRRYIDLMSAYSAVSFGHAHPRIVAALVEQAQTLAVTSRAFHNDRLPALLARLYAMTGLDRALPANSGLEAVETALKAARKWGYKVKGIPTDRAEIIVCHGNFHGRSITIVGFSSEAQYRDGFGPFAPGFVSDPVRRRRRARRARSRPIPRRSWSSRCRARPASSCRPTAISRAARDICRAPQRAADLRRNADRPRPHRASARRQHDGVRPDGVILGKALGGGLLPVSAFVATDDVMQVFRPATMAARSAAIRSAPRWRWRRSTCSRTKRCASARATLGAWLLARASRRSRAR